MNDEICQGENMITLLDLYHVMTAMVPLYVAMIAAYGSVKWWKIFSPDQCSGITRFVSFFAVPLLSFHFIASNNPYEMNYRFIAADTLQKIIILIVLTIWTFVSKRGCLDWTITLFSLSTLPNTLVMGIPLLKAMYGDFSASLMVQIVVLQCTAWYTLLMFLYEFRGARMLISEQFPETAGSIVSIQVDSDVASFDGRQTLETESEIIDGRLHVTVRRSSASRSDFFPRRALGPVFSTTPRPSNLTNAEIYSLPSSRNPTPRGSSFNHADFYSMMGIGGRNSNFGASEVLGFPTTPRPSNYEEDGKTRFHSHNHGGTGNYPAPNPGMFSPAGSKNVGDNNNGKRNINGNERDKDLHMFVWSGNASPVSDVFSGSHEYGTHDQREIRLNVYPGKVSVEGNRETNQEELLSKEESRFENRGIAEREMNNEQGKARTMPSATVMIKLILIMVWRKTIRNPNTYASLLGIVWSLVAFKWNIEMPAIIAKSISILSDAGLGMAMFTLGLFMALQPRLIACGNSKAAFAMAIRFLAGPAFMAAASLLVGLRGVLLRVAIVQATLPQGIVPFVFAKDYNLHPQILSTAVIIGMLIALPITLVYYILLGL